MKRIIWHWTAGGHRANGTDLRAYHVIIEGDGKVVMGNSPISANVRIAKPNDASTYAAHTRGLNTGSIGVAVAAMRGAKERQFDRGPSPITHAQITALIDRTADLCREYGIPVTRETVLSHAEVERTLGVKQRQKWDIMWIPGMAAPGDPIKVGDELRARVAARLAPPSQRPAQPQPARPAPVTLPPQPRGLWALLLALFGRKAP